MRPQLLLFAALCGIGLGIPGCGGGDPYDDADALMSRKRYSPAIVAYDELLMENPNSVRALMGRGRAYAATDDLEKAMADFNRAIELAPDHPEAYYRRAMLFERLDEPGKARLDEQYAHSIDPQYRKAFLAMENAMVPIADEEGEAEVPTEDAQTEQKADAELAGLATGDGASKISMSELSKLTFPETETSRSESDRIDFRTLGSSGATGADWRLTDSHALAPWLQLPEASSGVGEFQSPAWMSKIGANEVKSKPAEKKPTKTPPAAAARPVSIPLLTPGATAPNPYVRVPVPLTGEASEESSAPATTSALKPTGAGNTARPTGSPFPQPQLRRTGR